MKYKLGKLFFLFVFALAINGCTIFQKPKVSQSISWKEKQDKLAHIDNWFIKGSFSITDDRSRDAARFKWQQKKDKYVIGISGPFSIGGVSIVGDGSSVKFWRSDKESIIAKNPEQLVRKELGWELPVSSIRYWIFGIPSPYSKLKNMKFDDNGRVIYFEQHGWQIKFSKFEQRFIKWDDLPKVIELKKDKVFIKIKISGQDRF